MSILGVPVRWLCVLLIVGAAATLFFNVLHPRDVDAAFWTGVGLLVAYGALLADEVVRIVRRRTDLAGVVMFGWIHTCVLGLMYAPWHHVIAVRAFGPSLTNDWVREAMTIWLLVGIAVTLLLHLHWFLRGRWNTVPATLLVAAMSTTWLLMVIGVLLGLILPALQLLLDHTEALAATGESTLMPWLGFLGYVLLILVLAIYWAMRRARQAAVHDVIASPEEESDQPAWQRVYRSPFLWCAVLLLPLVGTLAYVVQPQWPGLTVASSRAANKVVAGLLVLPLVLLVLWVVTEILVLLVPRLRSVDKGGSVTAANWKGQLGTRSLSSAAGARTLLDWYVLLLIVSGLVSIATAGVASGTWRPFFPRGIESGGVIFHQGELLVGINRGALIVFGVSVVLAFGLIVHLFLKRYFTTVVSFRLVVKRALSYIAMLTVALGVFVLIVVTAVMGGFKQELRKRVRGSLSHVFMYLPIADANRLLRSYGFRSAELPELADLGDHYNLFARAMGERPNVIIHHEWLDAEAARRNLVGWDADLSFETKVVRVLADRLPQVDRDTRYERAMILALRHELGLPVPEDDDLTLDQVALQAKALLSGCPDFGWATTPEEFVRVLRLRDTLDAIDHRRDEVMRLNDPAYREQVREALQWALAETNEFVSPVAGTVVRVEAPGRWAHILPDDVIAEIRLPDGTVEAVEAGRHMMFHEPLVAPGEPVEVGTPLLRVRPFGLLRQPYEREILRDALLALDHVDADDHDVIAGASGRVRTMALIVRRHDKDLDYCQLVGIDPVHDLAISDVGMHLEQALYKEMDQALQEAMHRYYRVTLELFAIPGLPDQDRRNTEWHKIDPGLLNETGQTLLLQLQTTESLLSKVPPRDPGPDLPLRETELLQELKRKLEAILEARLAEIERAIGTAHNVTDPDTIRNNIRQQFEGIEAATRALTRGRSTSVWIGRSRDEVINVFDPDPSDPAVQEAMQLLQSIPPEEWQLLIDYYCCRTFRARVISGVRPLRFWTLGFRRDAGGPFERPVDENPPGIAMTFQPAGWPQSLPVLPDRGPAPVRTELLDTLRDALEQLVGPELDYPGRLDRLRQLRATVRDRLQAFHETDWPALEESLRDGTMYPSELWSELPADFRFSDEDYGELGLGLLTLAEWSNGQSRRVPGKTFMNGVNDYHSIDRLLEYGLPKVRAQLLDMVRGTGPFQGVTFVGTPDGIVVDRIEDGAAMDGAAAGDGGDTRVSAATQLQEGDRLEVFDGHPVPDFGALRDACAATAIGTTVELQVRRGHNGGGQTVTLSVTMDEPFQPGVKQIVPFDRFAGDRRAEASQQTQESNGSGRSGFVERGGPQDFPPAIVGDRLAEVYGAWGEPLSPGWRTRLHLATAVPNDELDDGSVSGDEEFEAREQGYHIAGTFHSRLFDDDRRRVYIPLVDALRFIDGSKTSALVGIKLGGTRYEQTRLYKALIACAAAMDEHGDLAALQNYIYANSPEPVRSWEEERANLLKAVDREELILTIVLSMIILYAGIMIIIIIYLMVKEKTKDIGILKALGGSPDGISSIFLFNGLFIGVFGALLGLLFGLTVVNQSNWIEDTVERIWGFRIFPADVYYLTYIPMKTSPETWLFICVPTILLAFLFALYPANKASRLDPVQSLQYE